MGKEMLLLQVCFVPVSGGHFMGRYKTLRRCCWFGQERGYKQEFVGNESLKTGAPLLRMTSRKINKTVDKIQQ
jgi:hypothetical protein